MKMPCRPMLSQAVAVLPPTSRIWTARKALRRHEAGGLVSEPSASWRAKFAPGH
jgi:hypothetical protein